MRCHLTHSTQKRIVSKFLIWIKTFSTRRILMLRTAKFNSANRIFIPKCNFFSTTPSSFHSLLLFHIIYGLNANVQKNSHLNNMFVECHMLLDTFECFRQNDKVNIFNLIKFFIQIWLRHPLLFRDFKMEFCKTYNALECIGFHFREFTHAICKLQICS